MFNYGKIRMKKKWSNKIALACVHIRYPCPLVSIALSAAVSHIGLHGSVNAIQLTRTSIPPDPTYLPCSAEPYDAPSGTAVHTARCRRWQCATIVQHQPHGTTENSSNAQEPSSIPLRYVRALACIHTTIRQPRIIQFFFFSYFPLIFSQFSYLFPGNIFECVFVYNVRISYHICNRSGCTYCHIACALFV